MRAQKYINEPVVVEAEYATEENGELRRYTQREVWTKYRLGADGAVYDRWGNRAIVIGSFREYFDD